MQLTSLPFQEILSGTGWWDLIPIVFLTSIFIYLNIAKFHSLQFHFDICSQYLGDLISVGISSAPPPFIFWALQYISEHISKKKKRNMCMHILLSYVVATPHFFHPLVVCHCCQLPHGCTSPPSPFSSPSLDHFFSQEWNWSPWRGFRAGVRGGVCSWQSPGMHHSTLRLPQGCTGFCALLSRVAPLAYCHQIGK